jgi:hypothetical protein
MINVWVFFGILLVTQLDAQVYLQLERAHSLRLKKFFPGEKIEFKTQDIPDYWQSGVIIDILPTDRSLVFTDRITQIEEISYFRFERNWPKPVSFTLTAFGISWLAFGGVIEGGRSLGVLDTEYTFGWDTALIGAGSLVSGLLIRKIWSLSVRKMNDRNRLRIIDLRP